MPVIAKKAQPGSRYRTAKGVVVEMDGRGRVRVLEYDSNAYTDTSDTLPARPAWVSRVDALKKARQIPRGACNVILREISG